MSEKFRTARKWVAILLAALIFCTFIAWGIASSWGAVNITRVEFVGNGGSTQSGWMFTPKGITDADPAPAIVNFHGRNTTAYNLIAWGIEQSRRGYISFLPDQQGTSETITTDDNTTERIAVSAVEYMLSQDFVTNVYVTGHSMGNKALAAVMDNENVREQVTSFVGVGTMFLFSKAIPESTNYMMIEAQKDFYANTWCPGVEAKMAAAEKLFQIEDIESGVLYGDMNSKTAREFVLLPTTHQQQMYSGDVIAEMLGFIEQANPAPNPISYDNQVFWWCNILLAFCSVLLICLVAEFAYMLAASPLFVLAVITELPIATAKAKGHWIKQVAKDLLIPIALFPIVTVFVGKHNPISLFRFGYVNRIFFWIFAVGLVGAILVFLQYRKKKKEGSIVSAADYGMAAAGESGFPWKRVGNGLIIASITTFMMFEFLDVVCKTTGLNYQFFCALGQLNRISPERVIMSIPYAVCCCLLLVVINISIATSRRAKSTGNEAHDTFRDILINIGLSAGALTIILLVQFVGIRLNANGVPPLGLNAFEATAYGLGFPFMMSCSAGISTFLYRKTGNIWVGVFTSSFVLIFLTCNSALVS